MNLRLFLLAILLVISVNSFGQKEYSSVQRDNYYQAEQELYSNRRLPDVEDVLHFKSPYCEIWEIEDYSAYVDSIIWRSPYLDSITNQRRAQMAIGDYGYIYDREELGSVYKGSIIKYEKRGTLEAFIYTDGKYSDIVFADPGIWVAVSRDAGKTWKHYFTGLCEYQPIVPKWYSKLPLIVDENRLQIEVAFVQQTENHSHPLPMQEYKLIKDGLVALFDLNLLALDSDADGLTDIVEEKFRTDLYKKDTNGNGISDDIDVNPRQNMQRSESTLIFETIIEKYFAPIDYNKLDSIQTRWDSLSERAKKRERAKAWKWSDIPPYTPNEYYASDSVQTVLIITDDPNIQAVRPQYVRVIILSSEEYLNSTNLRFKTELDVFSISPMLRVDGKRNLYLVKESYAASGRTYLIRKTRKGWRIKLFSMYIS